jgi:uncharacterized protein YkwD
MPVRVPAPALAALLVLAAGEGCLPSPAARPTVRTIPPRRPAAAPARPASDAVGLAALRREVLSEVNAERVRRGREPLGRDPALEQAAQRHAEDMLRRRYFEHESPEGRSVRDRVEDAGYSWRIVGENLASGPRTPDEAVDGWMGSPAHRRILLDRRFADLGVGYAEGGGSRRPLRLWVQVFGGPR